MFKTNCFKQYATLVYTEREKQEKCNIINFLNNMTETARHAVCIANREKTGEVQGTGEYTLHNDGRLELLIDMESIWIASPSMGPLPKFSLSY